MAIPLFGEYTKIEGESYGWYPVSSPYLSQEKNVDAIQRIKRIDAKALEKHRKRFLRFFPKAFRDERYIEWERTYKWDAHKLWKELLSKEELERLIRGSQYAEVATRALQVESKTNFLFSFEKMALRDALKEPTGTRIFSHGIYDLLHARGSAKSKFVSWIMSVSELPRKKSRVLSWPIVTFFPFIAQPAKHIIMKPTAMKFAADALGYDLEYSSKPSYKPYANLLELADLVGEGISDLRPKDYHDLQTFLWVIGSAEYDRLGQEL